MLLSKSRNGDARRKRTSSSARLARARMGRAKDPPRIPKATSPPHVICLPIATDCWDPNPIANRGICTSLTCGFLTFSVLQHQYLSLCLISTSRDLEYVVWECFTSCVRRQKLVKSHKTAQASSLFLYSPVYRKYSRFRRTLFGSA